MAWAGGRQILKKRAMLFVDGENLAIRFGKMLQAKGEGVPAHLSFEPNTYVWSSKLNTINAPFFELDVIRRYYYTSVSGDAPRIERVEAALKAAGFEAPRVFKKARGGRTKRVDISLATEMLTHAHRDNYEVAVLVAGDEDYVPLVEALAAEGIVVWLAFVESGLSSKLKLKADRYIDLSKVLLGS